MKERHKELFDDSGFYIGPAFPAECVKACSNIGDCYDACKEWVEKLNFECPREQVESYLRPFGNWSEEDIDAMEDKEMNITILWLACGEISDGNEWLGLVH